ncbi:MAG TPA: N-acetylmuramoyl-L-alanine amidase [Acidimicrobiia bacterium]
MLRRLAVPLLLVLGALAVMTASAARGGAQETPGPPEVEELPLDEAPASVEEIPPSEATVPPEGVPPETVPPETVPPEEAPLAPGWQAEVAVDANLIALKWAGDGGAEFAVEALAQDRSWRHAGDIGLHDNGPDPGTPEGDAAVVRNVSEPLWTGDVSVVRVTLTAGTATEVTLVAIDSPPVGDVPSVPAQQAGALANGLLAAGIAGVIAALVPGRRRLLALGVLAAILAVACAPVKQGAPGMPSIVSRHAWGHDLPWNAGGQQCGQSAPTIASGVGFAVVHHTVNSNAYSSDQSVQIVRGIWAYHTGTNGWCDIGYNFLIDRYGQIFEGRMGGWDKAVVGAHAAGFNTGSTGVAFIGDHQVTPVPGAAQASIVDLIAWKFNVHHTDPTPWNAIVGHRDVNQTACPGNAAYSLLPGFRSAVQARVS